MITLDPTNLISHDNYKLLIGSIVPRPIAFITSKSNKNIINGAPFSYFNIVSSKPPLVSVSVGRKNGEMKDTARNILENKEFVIHIVDEDNVKKINKTSASLPPDKSEIEFANLTLTESNFISVPGVKESKIRFECTLERIIELGDEHSINTDLIIGRIVCYHIDKAIYNNGKININKLQPMSRLAGADYATIGDIHTIERPK